MHLEQVALALAELKLAINDKLRGMQWIAVDDVHPFADCCTRVLHAWEFTASGHCAISQSLVWWKTEHIEALQQPAEVFTGQGEHGVCRL